MKRKNEILVKLNDVFLMNEVIEEIYTKTYKKVSNINIGAFLKERSLERSDFGKMLQNEINKFDTDVEEPIMSRRRYHIYMRSFNNLLRLENDSDLLNSIYNIELICIEKYNKLLREINLPLSLCRLLTKQQDKIQYGLRLIKKKLDLID